MTNLTKHVSISFGTTFDRIDSLRQSQQVIETGLSEVLIAGKRVCKSLVPHDNKG
jgi:hypothetical protein